MLLNDFETMNEILEERRVEIRTEMASNDSVLKEMNQKLASTMAEMDAIQWNIKSN